MSASPATPSIQARRPGAAASGAPAHRYTSAEWLERERRDLFARSWLAVGLAWRVARPGSYLTFDEGALPVVVVRDRDGVLRAFVNSCRHRGTRLLDGAGEVAAIRCPYHDWKYALDGRLRHIPEAAGFAAEPDKESLGLRPLRVAEALGFVWVTTDAEAPPITEAFGELVDEFAPYRLEEMRPIQEVTWTLACNWKAVLDNATESYHLARVHGASVGPLIEEAPDFRTYGDHYRLSVAIADSGWRRTLDRHTSRGGPYSERQQAALMKYVLFPNLLVNLVPCHLTVFQVWPVDAGHCRFFYGFYGRKGARPLEWLRARATWLASRYILREDRRVLDRFQAGVVGDDTHVHPLHDGERAIEHFHRRLDAWVGD
jgi:phenylpropionate dioxygenase-like ring-hydroxylating dioxygenase large terminal subunit